MKDDEHAMQAVCNKVVQVQLVVAEQTLEHSLQPNR